MFLIILILDDDPRVLPEHPNCGKSTPVETYRIHSQQNASHGDHPWFAILKDDNNKTFCGGSLINSQFVITGKKHFKSVE